AWTEYDGGGDIFAKSLMGGGEGGGFDDLRMSQQYLLDLGGRDLLPSSIDDVLDSPNDEEIAVPVEVSAIAGSKPAAAKCGLGGGDIVVVASCDGETPQGDLSLFAG